MSVMRWGRIAVSGVMLAGLLTACGGTEDTDVGTFQGLPNPPAAAGGGGGNTLVVDAAAGTALKFVQETLSASTGTPNT